jgi:hypothetical protein
VQRAKVLASCRAGARHLCTPRKHNHRIGLSPFYRCQTLVGRKRSMACSGAPIMKAMPIDSGRDPHDNARDPDRLAVWLVRYPRYRGCDPVSSATARYARIWPHPRWDRSTEGRGLRDRIRSRARGQQKDMESGQHRFLHKCSPCHWRPGSTGVSVPTRRRSFAGLR